MKLVETKRSGIMLSKVLKEMKYDIDFLLEYFEKGDKWQRLSRKLAKLLFFGWSEEQRKAINEVIAFLGRGEGKITKEEIREILRRLEIFLGQKLGNLLSKYVQDYQFRVYSEGRDVLKKLNIEFSFTGKDLETLNWLHKDMVYWIGTYWDRQISREIAEVVSEFIGEYNRELVGKKLAEKFKDISDKTQHYWEGLANHIVTRTREFARINAYEKANIKQYKIVAVIDERTSPICIFMNGKIIEVSEGIKLRDKLLTAKTPEDVKRIAPWYDVSEIQGKKMPLGLALPPYHFNCRTRTVPII